MQSSLLNSALNSTLIPLVILVTLVGVAVGRYPWLRMSRATIALTGSVILIVLGACVPITILTIGIGVLWLTLVF